jgi:hypothetical protein
MDMAALAAVGATALAVVIALVWLPARATSNTVHVEESTDAGLADVSS